MKKYLSCVILILLCLVCAMVFYANASDLWNNEEDSSSDSTENTDMVLEPDLEGDAFVDPKINTSGTILSEHFSSTNLRIEWSLLKPRETSTIYLSAELYLDTPNTITVCGDGYLMVNGIREEFSGGEKIGSSNLLVTHTQSIESDEDVTIEFDAFLNIDIEEAGAKFTSICAKGTVLATEAYLAMPQDCVLDFEHISQYPELPSGDEITSLAMVLSYLNYDVDKCDLCDLYLEKGPVGYTDFNKENVGNPRYAYNSYGCLPSVIANSARKYINANGGNFAAYDMTGANPDSLYYEISKGNSVIVWACEDFDITPTISRIWVIDGQELYWKSNMACMVLIGYDYLNGTVTLADPSGTVFEMDMELFEKGFSQMGSYALVIK